MAARANGDEVTAFLPESFAYDPERQLWRPGRRKFMFLFGGAVAGALVAGPADPTLLALSDEPALARLLHEGLLALRECFVGGRRVFVLDDYSGNDPDGLLSRPVPGGRVIETVGLYGGRR